MRYATITKTVLAVEEVQYRIEGDFPENFFEMSNEDKFMWLDENALEQVVISSESGEIKSIDSVVWDE